MSQQTTVSANTQTGGVLTVFDDINPTEVTSPDGRSMPIRSYKDMSDGLCRYLKRAQLIETRTWAASTPVGAWFTLDPWAHIASNTIIKEKIKYFSTLRADLHLRIVCNGTPFHYGEVLFAYVPLTPLTYTTFQDKYNHPATLFQVQHCQLSPTTSTPQEMKIDLVTQRDSIPLNGQTGTKLNELGRVYVNVTAPLLSANVAIADSVTIQIYAWCDNVKLGVPTPESVILGADEALGKGPISTVATSVATAASYFSNVPIIGRFALATEMGARAVASIASLFGYSNPVLIERYNMFKSQSSINYCQTVGRDSSKIYTYDPMNQLTIDPAARTGNMVDEMSYAFLYKIPLYMRSIPWANSAAPGDVLAVIGVCPQTVNRVASALPYTMTLAPINMLALTHDFWTGSLKFKFQVICSPYHKGRLQFRYIPYRTGSTIDGYGEATSQTVVMDIGLDSVKEIVVGWSMPQLWQRTQRDENVNGPLVSTENSNTAIGGAVAQMPNNCNGEIVVEVLTELTSPQLVAPIEIHVFMEGCDDLRFARPTAFNCNSNFAILGVDDPELAMGHELQAHVGGVQQIPNGFFKVTMGEDIVSLRSLLKRSMFAGIMTNNAWATAGPALVRSAYPLRRMPTNHGEQLFANAANTLLDVWQTAYLGVKGSLRYKVIRSSTLSQMTSASTYIGENVGGYITVGTNSVAVEAWDLGTLGLSKVFKQRGWAHTELTESLMEFVVPDYTPLKFDLTSPADIAGQYTYQSNPVILEEKAAFASETAENIFYEVYLALGEDMGFYRFSGMPQIIQGNTWQVDTFVPDP